MLLVTLKIYVGKIQTTEIANTYTDQENAMKGERLYIFKLHC